MITCLPDPDDTPKAPPRERRGWHKLPCPQCGGQGVEAQPQPTGKDKIVKCTSCNGKYYWKTDE